MLDILFLSIMSWSGMIGWFRGRWRALTDAVSVIVTVCFMSISVPVLKDAVIDGEWRLQLERWLQGHLRTPTKDSFPSLPALGLWDLPAQPLGERVYEILLISLSSFALIIGIQLILQVYQTLWPHVRLSLADRSLGLIIGLLLGLFADLYLMNGLGMLSWFAGMEFLDTALSHSFLVHMAVRWLPWIF